MELKFLWLIAAGGIGALSRYHLSGLTHRFFETSFPAGTFLVNIVGCFFFGLIWTLIEEKMAIGSEVRLIALTGFMGAFTTFSTFIYETASLMRFGQYLYAVVNLLGQNITGIIFLFLGMFLARAIHL